jgi:hypothetical protein
VRATEVCLREKGFDMGAMGGADRSLGIGLSVTFRQHGAMPPPIRPPTEATRRASDKAPRGVFIFMHKGNRADTVMRRLRQAGDREIFGKPRRNVIPSWNSAAAADARFKAIGESCLK